MSNMNNFNNSIPDALSSSKAIMGSGHNFLFTNSMNNKGKKDLTYLQRNSITVQVRPKVLDFIKRSCIDIYL